MVHGREIDKEAFFFICLLYQADRRQFSIDQLIVAPLDKAFIEFEALVVDEFMQKAAVASRIGECSVTSETGVAASSKILCCLPPGNALLNSSRA